MKEARQPFSGPTMRMMMPVSSGPAVTDAEMTSPKTLNAFARAWPLKYCWIMPIVCGL